MTQQLSALIHVFMYSGRLVKIGTALYPISTQRNLAVPSENISMLLNPDFYGSTLQPRVNNLNTIAIHELVES